METLDISVIPLAAGKKTPAFKQDWMLHATRDRRKVENWLKAGLNIGFVTDVFCVLDFDDPTLAALFLETRRDIITTIVGTPSGGKHFYFAGQTKNRQCEGFDVKSVGGYVAASPSVFESKKYLFETEMRAPQEMHSFPKDYVDDYDATHGMRKITREVRDASSYVMQIESRGSKGCKGLVRACAVLRDAGYTEAQAMLVLLDWNNSDRVDPKWPVHELARACSNTFLKAGA